MNEFTKDELELISQGLYAISEPGIIDLKDVPKMSGLQSKIHSLVDNYCEHDWREDFSNVTAETCLECGKSRIM